MVCRADTLLKTFEFLPSKMVTQKIEVSYRASDSETRLIVNKLLTLMQSLGSMGSSRTIKVDVDGDGSFGFRIKGIDKVDLSKEMEQVSNSDDVVIKY